jgi:hypothetical protein
LKAIASTFSAILENMRSFSVGVGVGVGVGDGVGVGNGVGVGEGVGDGVGVGEGVGVDEGVGVAFLTVTPLFHTNFLPDLTQVYVFFIYVVF